MPPDWRLFHVRRSTGKRLFFEVPLSPVALKGPKSCVTISFLSLALVSGEQLSVKLPGIPSWDFINKAVGYVSPLLIVVLSGFGPSWV